MEDSGEGQRTKWRFVSSMPFHIPRSTFHARSAYPRSSILVPRAAGVIVPPSTFHVPRAAGAYK